MSPRKVNKEKKRREIALACYSLVHKGIKKITVAEVAKTAGIGKGTVYEYFENKEDIIFEIINIHIEEYHEEFLESIKNVESTKEKVLHLLRIVMDDSPETLEHFNGYKDYLSIVLSDDNESMKEYNTSCTDFFANQLGEILNEGIQKGEIVPESINLVMGLMCFEKGAAVMKMSEKGFNAKEVCLEFVNALFEIIELKK